jgi:hypothetical protein
MIALLGLCLAPLAARGGTIVSNLAAPPGSFSPVTVTDDTWWAQQFTSGGPAVLTQIITQLGNLDTGNSGDFTLSAALYSVTSASNLPDLGTFVTSFSVNQSSIPTGNFADISFTPTPSPVALDPSLYYWFVLTGSSSDGTGGVDWQFTDTSSTTGPGSLTGVGRYDTPGPWGSNDHGPFVIDVEGRTLVPEPASLLMGTIGLSAFAAVTSLRKLRRRAG